MFNQLPELAERMRQLRTERLQRISAGNAPTPLLDQICLVLHIVPSSHFDLGARISIQEIVSQQDRFPPMGTRSPSNFQVNFDGFVTLSPTSDRDQARRRAYVQIFRTGAIEAVASSIARSDNDVDIRSVDYMIVQYTRNYSCALHDFAIEPPLVVMASLLGVRGRTLLAHIDDFDDRDGAVADRDPLCLNEIILEEVPESNQSCATMLRPMLDHLANAAGRASALGFDRSGTYVFGVRAR
jgi:hypothetical protein